MSLLPSIIYTLVISVLLGMLAYRRFRTNFNKRGATYAAIFDVSFWITTVEYILPTHPTFWHYVVWIISMLFFTIANTKLLESYPQFDHESLEPVESEND